MWRRLIRRSAFGCTFSPGVAEAELGASERALQVVWPAELADFLRETDGASAAYDAELVWSLAEIVLVNGDVAEGRALAAPGAPAERLLFFAGDGKRGRYAYVLVHGAARDADVFFQAHATDSHHWVAPSLATYVERRLDGTLPREAELPDRRPIEGG